MFMNLILFKIMIKTVSTQNRLDSYLSLVTLFTRSVEIVVTFFEHLRMPVTNF